MQLRPSRGGEILQNVRRDLCRYEKVTAARAYTDIAHSFPSDAGAHQCPKKIPVIGTVPLVENCPQAHTG